MFTSESVAKFDRRAIARAWGLAIHDRRSGIDAAREQAQKLGYELNRQDLMLIIDREVGCNWRKAARL